MGIDRATSTDADGEQVEEGKSTDRPPPPPSDRPGQEPEGVPSRLEARRALSAAQEQAAGRSAGAIDRKVPKSTSEQGSVVAERKPDPTATSQSAEANAKPLRHRSRTSLNPSWVQEPPARNAPIPHTARNSYPRCRMLRRARRRPSRQSHWRPRRRRGAGRRPASSGRAGCQGRGATLERTDSHTRSNLRKSSATTTRTSHRPRRIAISFATDPNPVPVFDGPPTRDQAVQGDVGDCGIVAALGSVAEHRPEAIKDAIKPAGDGEYEITLHEITEATPADPVARPTGDVKTYRVNDVLPVNTDEPSRPLPLFRRSHADGPLSWRR